MKKLALIFILTLTLAPMRSNANDKFLDIVAIVNGEIISTEDFGGHMNAFAMNTGIPLNDETRNVISKKALNNAIEERIRLQEADKNNIKVSENEINAAIKSFETNNKMGKGELREVLKKHKVSNEVFRRQIQADLAWAKLIRWKASSEINITQKEIEKALTEAEKDLSIPKHQVLEIMIPKKGTGDIASLVNQLREDSRFELYAMQFSQSPSASSGGNLGWVNKGNMQPALETALSKMKEGEISEPIEIGGNFYILKLVKTFNPKQEKTSIPSEEEMRSFLEKKKLEEFANRHLKKIRQSAIIEIKS